MSVLDKLLDAVKLNDDYDEDDYLDDDLLDSDDDDFLDDDQEDKPVKKFFQKFSKKADDEEVDDFDDEEPVAAAPKQPVKTVSIPKVSVKQDKPVRSTSSKITPMRSSRKGSQAANMEVCVIKPTSVEDSREITETLLSGRTVILNLEGLDLEIAQRIIDFTSGATFAISGNLQKISNYIFLVTPTNVDISGDLQDLLNTSLDSSSMRTRF